jgi:AsmA-like C-terminal region
MITQEEQAIANETPKHKKGFFRFLFKAVSILALVVIALLFVAVALGYYYQNEVKDYFVSELNKKLNTEVVVKGENIDFSLIQNFPLAAIEFNNILVKDAIEKKQKDTLFWAENISLQFSWLDVFHKKYKVQKLEINHAVLKIKLDKNGNDNFHFWKADSSNSTENLRFDLQEISLQHIRFSYINKKLKQKIAFYVLSSKLSGEFSSNNYFFSSTARLQTDEFIFNNTSFLKNKSVNANIHFAVDKSKGTYTLENTHAQIEDLLLDINGLVTDTKSGVYSNLQLKGKDMDVQSVLWLVPEKYKSKINNYKSTGTFYLDAAIIGESSERSNPHVDARFGINNGTINETQTQLVLQNVNIGAHYSNGNENSIQSSVLEINNLNASMGSGSIACNARIQNFAAPQLKGAFSLSLNLAEWRDFLKLDTLETLTGNLQTNFTMEGPISKANIENIKSAGSLKLSNVSGKFKNATFDYKNISADIVFDNNNVEISKLKGNIGNSDFDLSGKAENVMGFILHQNEKLHISAELKSEVINLNDLLSQEQKGSTNTAYTLRLSPNLNVDFSAKINRVTFRHFDATDIRGDIRLQNQQLYFEPLTLKTMEGSVLLSGLLNAQDSTNLVVSCTAQLDNISIPLLFYAFENFGQKNLTDKNIKGKTNANIEFAAGMNNALQINTEKMYCSANISIQNGELIQVDALKKLSRFISLDDLQHIKFASLKNTIEIKDKKVIIPQMEVRSNALNIWISGTHSFDNKIDYRFKLSFSELLAQKAKRNKKENTEFGEVAEDNPLRTNIYLSMTGTTDKPIFKYDTRSAAQGFKQNIKQEKQNFKSVLKDEFGLFKKDSTLNNKKKSEEGKFKIQWNESNEKPQEQKEIRRPTKPEEDDF